MYGALHEALERLREKIDFSLADFSDNPLLDGERMLSVGCFHNQHLVNQVEQLAQPVSLHTAETSEGQEDYMSMAIPALTRIDDMLQLCRALLAYELLAAVTAVRMLVERPGDGVAAVIDYLDPLVSTLRRYRPLAPDVETILAHFDSPAFIELTH